MFFNDLEEFFWRADVVCFNNNSILFDMAFLLKLFNKLIGVIYALLISMLWATIVAMLGKSDVRVWNSFFLQYLWEFVLGMYLAKCYKLNSEIVNLLNFKILVPVCILCVAFTGVAGLKEVFGNYIMIYLL